MKNRTVLYHIYLYSLITTVVFVLFIVSEAFPSEYKNDKFYFSINIPDKWIMIKESQNNSDLYVLFRSPDKKQTISLYAIKAKEKVDLEKLSETDKKLFRNLGELESNKPYFTNNLRTFGIFPASRIEKLYKSGKQKTKLCYKVTANFAYIFVGQGSGDDFAKFDRLVASFESAIPFREIWKSTVTGFGSWVVYTIISLIIITGLYALGKLGFLLRKGIEVRKALKKIKFKLSQQGHTVSEKWHKYLRKATLWITFSISGCLLLYVVLLITLPIKIFLLSFLGVIPIILGYFGIFFVPDEEGIVESLGEIV